MQTDAQIKVVVTLVLEEDDHDNLARLADESQSLFGDRLNDALRECAIKAGELNDQLRSAGLKDTEPRHPGKKAQAI